MLQWDYIILKFNQSTNLVKGSFICFLMDLSQKQDKNKLDANCIMTHLSISVKRADKQMQRITVKWKEEQKIGNNCPGISLLGCLRKCVFRFPKYEPTCSTYLNFHSIDSNSEILSDIFIARLVTLHWALQIYFIIYIFYMILVYFIVEVPIK